MTDVHCNGCTLCCHRDAVRLLPGDDPGEYQTEPHFALPGQLMLAHKPNGDCVYLGERGCTTHDQTPQQCRDMDCRNIYISLTRRQALNLGVLAVWKQGRKQRG